jgi:predicted metal-dependent RNase
MTFHYVSDIESSRELQEDKTPCIVIAGSWMCEGGRILHHFTKGLGHSTNTAAAGHIKAWVWFTAKTAQDRP